MTAPAAIFICSICGEPSVEICVYCTKDACSNHRCERCKRCSDCCECEIPLSAARAEAPPEPSLDAPLPFLEPIDSTIHLPAESVEIEAAVPPESEPAEQATKDIPPPHNENPIF